MNCFYPSNVIPSVVENFNNFVQERNSKIFVIYRFSQARKRSSHFFPPHVSRAQRLAPVRTTTRVVGLGAQCADHWTTEQSRGVGVPAVQLTTHIKSAPCTVVHPNFFGLMGYNYFLYYEATLCELRYYVCLAQNLSCAKSQRETPPLF